MTGLAAAWLRTAQAVGARGDVAGTGAALLARWSEPHRRYHALSHLSAVLSRVDELAGHATDLDAVRLAAWFHDAVYDPRRADNEARSAAVATDQLARLAVDPDRVVEVDRLVRLTATHAPGPDDRDGAVLCDADLAVLASPASVYAAYVEGVRGEYGHLDAAAFAAGRAAVLRALLDRPTLFSTGHGRTSWEEPARGNLVAELTRLGQPRAV